MGLDCFSIKICLYCHEIGKLIVDDRDIKTEQIRCSLAWLSKAHQREQSPEDRQYYASAEQFASVRLLGIWHDIVPAAHWVWRHPVKTALE
jgi:hypothetical protein